MSRVTGNKSAAPKKSGNPMLMGILLGMIVGVAMAAGLAWFILKSPSPFVNKQQSSVEFIKPDIVKPNVVVARPAPEVNAASGVDDTKPRFEFYKVLTDKPGATGDKVQPKSAETTKVDESKPSPRTTYLQAGAFANAADAENLKASLAMKGLEASIQTVSVAGKGEMHRVRVGPFQNEQEMISARGTLKLNGLEATPTH